MVISSKVFTAHKEYWCELCQHRIYLGEKYIRKFGSSDDRCKEPRPYEIMICQVCGKDEIRYVEECKGDNHVIN